MGSILDLSNIITNLNMSDCSLGTLINSRSLDIMMVLLGFENVTDFYNKGVIQFSEQAMKQDIFNQDPRLELGILVVLCVLMICNCSLILFSVVLGYVNYGSKRTMMRKISNIELCIEEINLQRSNLNIASTPISAGIHPLNNSAYYTPRNTV